MPPQIDPARLGAGCARRPRRRVRMACEPGLDDPARARRHRQGNRRAHRLHRAEAGRLPGPRLPEDRAAHRELRDDPDEPQGPRRPLRKPARREGRLQRAPQEAGGAHMRLSDVTREPAEHAAVWPTTEPPEQTSALQQYLRTLRRRKWIVLQALILTPLAAAFLSLRQQPQYQATASVLLANETVASVLPGSGDSASADRIAQTQADIARTPEVLSRAIARVPGAGNVTVDGLLSRSSVSPRTNSDVLELRVEDESASRA